MRTSKEVFVHVEITEYIYTESKGEWESVNHRCENRIPRNEEIRRERLLWSRRERVCTKYRSVYFCTCQLESRSLYFNGVSMLERKRRGL